MTGSEYASDNGNTQCQFQNLKTSLKNIKKCLYILEVLIKTTITNKNRSTVPYNLNLLDMDIFNELVIKNDPVKKATLFHCFFGRGSTASLRSLGIRRKNFPLQDSQ